MKKILLAITLLSTPIITSANNFNMPGFNNNNGYNNGSSWNMPNMNWGNNGNNNGSSWNMPNMNWGNSNNGNGFNNGSSWTMPNMNWGNNNGYNNGSSWNIPNMNWGNSNNGNGFNNGTNWTMPNMNWGTGNNQPWNFGNNFGNNNGQNIQYRQPSMPVAPQFIPRLDTKGKMAKPVSKQTPKATKPSTSAPTVKAQVENKIPMPSEVKGTILAPENKIKVEAK